MVLSLISRTERNIDILLRKVDHIEQMVQEGRTPTSPPPPSESTFACAGGPSGHPSMPHPVLVGQRLGADPSRLMLDAHLAMTEAITRGAKVTNDNPFWFSMATEPIHMHIPQVPNPLFENKGRAAEYQFLYIF